MSAVGIATARIPALEARPMVRAAARSERVPLRRYPLVIVLAGVCAGGSWYALWRNHHLRPAMIALGVALAAARGAWHHARWNLFGDDDLGRFALGSQPPICLEAIARSAPRQVPTASFTPLQPVRPEEQWRFAVEPIAVRDGAVWCSASGRAQVTVIGKLTGIHAGDRLQIFGHFYAPEPAGNPGEFDYALQDRGNRELSLVHVKRPECVALWRIGTLCR